MKILFFSLIFFPPIEVIHLNLCKKKYIFFCNKFKKEVYFKYYIKNQCHFEFFLIFGLIFNLKKIEQNYITISQLSSKKIKKEDKYKMYLSFYFRSSFYSVFKVCNLVFYFFTFFKLLKHFLFNLNILNES